MEWEWPVPRLARLAALLAAIAIVGLIDYQSGPEIGMSIFYVAAIAAGAWYGGLAEAIVTALAATACWFAADLSAHGAPHVWISAWNGTTRLVMYVSIGVLTAIVRADRDRLREVNDRLAGALEAERSVARTDSLTGLPNSRAFYEKLDRVIAISGSTAEAVCIGLIDIDNFKRVNDIYGHAAGDDLLKRIADEVRGAVRSDDFAARLGGDEFVILFREFDPAAAEAVGGRIVDRVTAISGEFPGTDLGASIGIAVFTGTPESRDAIIFRADNAMYEAKAAGRRRVVVFSDATADATH